MSINILLFGLLVYLISIGLQCCCTSKAGGTRVPQEEGLPVDTCMLIRAVSKLGT